MDRPDHDRQHEWHVAINQFNTDPNNFQHWMYDAKRMSDEIPRLAILFRLERNAQLPDVHQQCSHASQEPVVDNHLTYCLGVKCKECPFLLALGKAKLQPEGIDEIKAWTCAAHILSEKKNRSFDDSEGYILTVDDRMFWDNVYESLATPDELPPEEEGD